jgi:phosphoglucosamine mutase
MTRLFGTDGVRGVANRDLTPDLALALGRAAGLELAGRGGSVVVGRDTRLSGPMLEAALVAGLCSAGARAVLAGVLPTPAIAFLTIALDGRAGVVISASHNPVGDNGIKFFSPEGIKISEEAEGAIEAALTSPPPELPLSEDVGSPTVLADAAARYLEHLAAAVDRPLAGLRIVLDCAYGAAWDVAPRAFRDAGAEVIAMNDSPDGARINVGCGSTAMAAISEAVVDSRADLGFAFDGDADRVLGVDERGEVVDGDRLIGLSALRLAADGALKNEIVVATVMANLGFKRALERHGISVVGAPVGDKYVAQEMERSGAALGGEQSGHIIFAEHSTTGDGILAGLKVACALVAGGSPMSELAHFFEPFPQVLVNVEVRSRHDLDTAQALWEDVRRAEAALGEDGRVLLRASGTEPVVRVMVEDIDRAVAERTAAGLADSVRRHLG